MGRYPDCAALYRILKLQLGAYVTFPPEYPVLQQFAIVCMYTRASTVEMKEKILSSFCDTNGVLRVVLATTAFGMGVDCPDVRVIYHWVLQVWKSICKNLDEQAVTIYHQKQCCYTENQKSMLEKKSKNMV